MLQHKSARKQKNRLDLVYMKYIQTTRFDYLKEESEMSEEWKKELLTKYFIATFNFTKEEAKNVIKQYFKDEITLEEEKVKEVILF